jgi:tRNA(Ile)-lysidine synthase
LNPNIQRVLVQVADIAQVENDFVEQQLQEFVSSSAVRIEVGRISLNRKTFYDLHLALQRRAVLWGADQLKTSSETLDYQHVVEAIELAHRGRQGKIALLGDGLQLRIDYDWLVIERDGTAFSEVEQPLIDEGAELSVQIPGVTSLPGSRWELQTSSKSNSKGDTNEVSSFEARLAIPEQAVVTLRGRRSGDHFAPLGLGGHNQKINHWMINRKIPRHLRARIPMLIVNGEVAAIAVKEQWSVSESYAQIDNTPHIVYFQFRQNS